MTPAEVLRSAADAIDRDGWCQNAASDGLKRCARAAILDTQATNRECAEAFSALLWYLGDYLHVHVWNDRAGRTAEEVVAAMRAAADAWEAR